jgi:hypothetical protein
MFKNCNALSSIIAKTDASKIKFEDSTNFPSGCVVTVK